MRVSRIQSIDRVARLLDVLAEAGPSGAPLRVVAAQVGLKPSTAHNLLASLIVHRAAEQDSDTSHYRLGPWVLALARRYEARADLASTAAPVLQRLWGDTRETVFLSVLRDGRRVDLVTLVSPQVLGVDPQRYRRPTTNGELTQAGPRESRLHATAAGKVLLAGLPEAEARALLAAQRLPRWTPQTVTDEMALLAELAAVRQQGYATNREENHIGVCGVAAPVYNAGGSTIAALCIGYPAARATADHEARLCQAVRAAAAELSGLLGYVATAGGAGNAAGSGDADP